jgi:hypothetical protein
MANEEHNQAKGGWAKARYTKVRNGMEGSGPGFAQTFSHLVTHCTHSALSLPAHTENFCLIT